MVASHLDEGLVELEAGGGEGIEVGSVHGKTAAQTTTDIVKPHLYLLHPYIARPLS